MMGSMTPSPTGNDRPVRPHIRYLDGLRGFAALYVAYSHLLLNASLTPVPQFLLLRLWAKWSPMSHFAVSAFIILSGYCLLLPLLKTKWQMIDGIGNYFARRFARIAPAFYAAFLLSVLIATQLKNLGEATTLTNANPVTAVMAGAHLAFLHNVIPSGSLPYNGVLWSVGVEWWIYFSLPLLLLLWRRTGKPIVVTLIAVVFYYVLYYVVRGTPLAGFRFEYFALFSLGGLCAQIGQEEKFTAIKPRLWLILSAAGFVLTFGIIGLLGWRRCVENAHLLDLPFSLYFCALLLFLRQSPNHLLTRFWSHPWLAILGTFSYSLYLIHYPLETLFIERVLPFFPQTESIRFFVLLLICMPIVLALSYVFYLLVEAPSLRWSQSLKKQKPIG
jgi:peptidoglycan/LPS O-acetylase OafA/YrhL